MSGAPEELSFAGFVPVLSVTPYQIIIRSKNKHLFINSPNSQSSPFQGVKEGHTEHASEASNVSFQKNVY